MYISQIALLAIVAVRFARCTGLSLMKTWVVWITGKITQKFGLFLPTGFYSVSAGQQICWVIGFALNMLGLEPEVEMGCHEYQDVDQVH